jgi:hypothetical protein
MAGVADPGAGASARPIRRRWPPGSGVRWLVAQSVERQAEHPVELTGFGKVDHRDPAEQAQYVIEAGVGSRDARRLGSLQQWFARSIHRRPAAAEDLGVMHQFISEGPLRGDVATK